MKAQLLNQTILENGDILATVELELDENDFESGGFAQDLSVSISGEDIEYRSN